MAKRGWNHCLQLRSGHILSVRNINSIALVGQSDKFTIFCDTVTNTEKRTSEHHHCHHDDDGDGDGDDGGDGDDDQLMQV